MAPDQSALLKALEVLKAAEVDDRIRQAAETIYQALVEAELSAVIGAFPHVSRWDSGRADDFDAVFGGDLRGVGRAGRGR